MDKSPVPEVEEEEEDIFYKCLPCN